MDDHLVAVINLSYALDKKACDVYTRFAKSSEDEELARFWESMAGHERKHIQHWQQLQEMAQRGRLAQVFDGQIELQARLEELVGKFEALVAENDRVRDAETAFLVAYRLELYLMHPALTLMLHFLGPFAEAGSPVDDYDGHILSLINACHKWCGRTPVLDLLGETLYSLWTERSKVAYQGAVDPQTSVLNRRSLIRTMKTFCHLAHRNQTELGVLVLDVDNLKQINDEHGYEVGDRLLRFVADCIRERVRRSDVIGRYGGDEFLVCFPGLDAERLDDISDDIRKRVEEESKSDIEFTVSIGASHCVPSSDVGTCLNELIRLADEHLYQAKRGGRNRCESGVFKPVDPGAV